MELIDSRNGTIRQEENEDRKALPDSTARSATDVTKDDRMGSSRVFNGS